MRICWLLASLHLIALAIGAGAIWSRTIVLRATTFDREALRRVFRAVALEIKPMKTLIGWRQAVARGIGGGG